MKLPAKRRLQLRTANRSYRARLRDRARALFGNRCGDCGASESEDFEVLRIEFAHLAKTRIRGRGRGTTERLRDVLENPESYALLCRHCHMDRDYAGIDPWNPEPDPRQGELAELADSRGGAVLKPRPRRHRPREWFYVVRMPGKTVSSKAHFFVQSIAVCSVNYIAGPRAGLGAERCRNCLRMQNAEVFR